MPEMRTADIQKWLATDLGIQKLVAERLPNDPGDDPDFAAYVAKARKDSANPKKWVRRRKYKVGSDTDSLKLGEPLPGTPDLTGGIVREFWLRDTDHVTVLTVEKDGKIVFFEDMSD